MQLNKDRHVIYLDNNATTALSAPVKNIIRESLDKYYNPSAVCQESKSVEEDVNNARASVAALIKAESDKLIFNSGATEGNNTVLFNSLFPMTSGKKHIIISSVEHPAILETAAFYESNFGLEVTRLPVDNCGRISEADLKGAIKTNTVLVSIMLANNEIGNIYPIKRFAEIVHGFNKCIMFHTDATQAIGKMDVDVEELGVDYLTMSGHKFHAPKGVGVLYSNKKENLIPFIHGGHQEGRKRAGTENTLSIIALGEAARNLLELSDKDYQKVADLRNDFERRLKHVVKNAVFLGDLENRICNTSCVLFPDYDGLLVCEYVSTERGICISTGSACDSINHKPSHVMKALNINIIPIRVSLNRDNSKADIVNLVQSISSYVNKYPQGRIQ